MCSDVLVCVLVTVQTCLNLIFLKVRLSQHILFSGWGEVFIYKVC